MIIKELKEGKEFMYDNKVHKLEEIAQGSWIISVSSILGMFAYVASVKKIGTKKIDCYTYVLGKRVSVSIHIDECKEVIK